jgi:predicted transcriptional regulator
MSESSPSAVSGSPGTFRTLAVRISDELRAQLDVLAQLNNRSVTEEIRVGLESWIESSKSDPKILERAEAVRAGIEREAKTKQGAIEAIFGGAARPRSRGAKPQE